MMRKDVFTRLNRLASEIEFSLRELLKQIEELYGKNERVYSVQIENNLRVHWIPCFMMLVIGKVYDNGEESIIGEISLDWTKERLCLYTPKLIKILESTINELEKYFRKNFENSLAEFFKPIVGKKLPFGELRELLPGAVNEFEKLYNEEIGRHIELLKKYLREYRKILEKMEKIEV